MTGLSSDGIPLRRRGPVARAVLAALRFYQRAVSPALQPRCRFYPTCSAYAVEAVERHGAARGTWLALRRLLKCAPWHPGGVDLVPEPRASAGTAGPGAPSSGGEHPDADDRGTGDAARSSSREAPSRPDRAIPPAASRTPQQEAGVA